MISIGMPPLLGMLISGMLLKNFNVIFGIEGADPVAALPNSWSEGIRASGLSVILMESNEKQHYDLICNVLLVVLVYSCEIFIKTTGQRGMKK